MGVKIININVFFYITTAISFRCKKILLGNIKNYFLWIGFVLLVGRFVFVLVNCRFSFVHHLSELRQSNNEGFFWKKQKQKVWFCSSLSLLIQNVCLLKLFEFTKRFHTLFEPIKFLVCCKIGWPQSFIYLFLVENRKILLFGWRTLQRRKENWFWCKS